MYLIVVTLMDDWLSLSSKIVLVSTRLSFGNSVNVLTEQSIYHPQESSLALRVTKPFRQKGLEVF